MKEEEIRKVLTKQKPGFTCLDVDDLVYITGKAERLLEPYPCVIKPFIHCVFTSRHTNDMVAMTFGKNGRVREIHLGSGKANPNWQEFVLQLDSKGLYEGLLRTEPYGVITHHTLEKLLGVKKGRLNWGLTKT